MSAFQYIDQQKEARELKKAMVAHEDNVDCWSMWEKKSLG